MKEYAAGVERMTEEIKTALRAAVSGCDYGLGLRRLDHSGMRHRNSGLPEFGNIVVQVGKQPTWMRQARNP